MNIGESLKYLYSKFILRDLLSYSLPGALPIFVLSLMSLGTNEIYTYISAERSIFEIVLFLLIAYTNGHIISSVAKLFKNYKDYPDTKLEDFLDRMISFNLIEENRFKEQRERYVVLKQFYRNMQFGLIISLIIVAIYAIKFCNYTLEGILIWGFGFLGVVAFRHEFISVRAQQKIFEDKVLEKTRD